ncbi:uncharacterized protein METZ01_LOCUS255658 [marine metagenome]|uniref:Uncharacterized protein n=1 Tax=marine metagenome TaxID=408172 RepID=A0A382ISH1_9ZZZZ
MILCFLLIILRGKSITLVFSGTSLIIVVPIPTKQSFPILIF